MCFMVVNNMYCMCALQIERILDHFCNSDKCRECSVKGMDTCHFLTDYNGRFCCSKAVRKGLRACFPLTATVSLENGETVTMAELRRGDKVQTGRKERRH